MVEIDSNNNIQLKKSWHDSTDNHVHFLMTYERTQALDLLVHLISTSTDSIILCGPEGIGKTNLLKVLQHREMTPCLYCPIEGYKELSLTKVQELLQKARKQEKSDKFDQAFTRTYGEQKSPYKKRVLIIDNAGFLAPGLMTQILQYANENPYLKVIFVLTHDQLHLKNKSDQAIEDCHIVEIPPLSEKQCGDFLKHLSSKSSSALPISAISESLVAAIYRDSQGVPAKIITEFSAITKTKKQRYDNPTQLLVVAVAGLVVLALFVQWFSSRQTITEAIAPEKAIPIIADAAFNQPYITLPLLAPTDKLQDNYLQLNLDAKLPGNETVSETPLLDGDRNIGNLPSPVMGLSTLDTPTESSLEKPKLTEALPQPIEEKALSEEKTVSTVNLEGSAWLSAQPENHYTLQLMVLSKEQSIINVMKKYPALQQDFKYFRRLIGGREKFVLLYGSFNDRSSANTIKQNLPSEFRQSFPRKMSAIQKELDLPPKID